MAPLPQQLIDYRGGWDYIKSFFTPEPEPEPEPDYGDIDWDHLKSYYMPEPEPQPRFEDLSEEELYNWVMAKSLQHPPNAKYAPSASEVDQPWAHLLYTPAEMHYATHAKAYESAGFTWSDMKAFSRKQGMRTGPAPWKRSVPNEEQPEEEEEQQPKEEDVDSGKENYNFSISSEVARILQTLSTDDRYRNIQFTPEEIEAAVTNPLPNYKGEYFAQLQKTDEAAGIQQVILLRIGGNQEPVTTDDFVDFNAGIPMPMLETIPPGIQAGPRDMTVSEALYMVPWHIWLVAVIGGFFWIGVFSRHRQIRRSMTGIETEENEAAIVDVKEIKKA